MLSFQTLQKIEYSYTYIVTLTERKGLKISKATKILWVIVIGFLAIMFLLAMINIDSPLPELMAESFGIVFFGALALQFIIYTINKFILGLKGD